MSAETCSSGTFSEILTPALDNIQQEALQSQTLALRRDSGSGLRKAPLALSLLVALGLLVSSLPFFQTPSSAYGAEKSPTPASTPTATLILERTPTPALTPESKRIIADVPESYSWINKDGIYKRDRFFAGTNGFGSNNPGRIITTIEQCDFNHQNQTVTNCINWQPDETKFPETQTSRYVNIEVNSLVVERFNNTDVGFATISIPNYPEDGRVALPRILRIGDMNHVTDNSNQSEYHAGLPQGGFWWGGSFYVNIYIDYSGNNPSANLYAGITNSLNVSENGVYRANLDHIRGTYSSGFVKEYPISSALYNPYYWINKDGVNKRVTVYNVTHGFAPNNPNRRVDTLEQCDFNPQTQSLTNCIYFQPDETLFPEIQTNTDFGIAVYPLVVKNFNNTDIGFSAISIGADPLSQQANVFYPRILRIGDMNNVTDYSFQNEYHEGLPQGGGNGLCDDTYSFSIYENGTEIKLTRGIQCQQNPADNGNYEANLDSNLGTYTGPFVKEGSTPTPTPTFTVTSTPTVTATWATTYRIFVPPVQRSFTGGW